MKKFNFKLKGLLKYREFLEVKAKRELGEVVQRMFDLESENTNIKDEIQDSYSTMLKQMDADSFDARQIDFFYNYVRGRDAKIHKNREALKSVKQEFEKKLKIMSKARADVKVIEKLKEGQLFKFKKEIEKHELDDMEDIIRMRKIGGNLQK